MLTVDLPLTEAEQAALQAQAASAGLSVSALVTVWIREELAAETPLVPNLG